MFQIEVNHVAQRMAPRPKRGVGTCDDSGGSSNSSGGSAGCARRVCARISPTIGADKTIEKAVPVFYKKGPRSSRLPPRDGWLNLAPGEKRCNRTRERVLAGSRVRAVAASKFGCGGSGGGGMILIHVR